MSHAVFKRINKQSFEISQRRKLIADAKLRAKKALEKSEVQKVIEEKEIANAILNLDRRKKQIKKRLTKEGYEDHELTWLNT